MRKRQRKQWGVIVYAVLVPNLTGGLLWYYF